MGLNPVAADRQAPFIRMAGELGLGAHRLEDIGIRGETIDAVCMNFRTTN
jgi:hypothetical protein